MPDSFRDRTDAERALLASERRYRQLVETMPYGMEEVDFEGRVVFANRALGEILGYPVDELVGTYVWDRQVEPEGRERLRDYIHHLTTHQPPPTPYRGRNVTGEGRAIEIQVDWDYKRDDAGNAVGFVAVVTDVTESVRNRKALQHAHDEMEQRVRERTGQLNEINCRLEEEVQQRCDAEAKLRAAHEFLQSVIDALSAHVAVLDSCGVIVLVNRAWREFADANGLRYENHGLGYNYLEVARSATGPWSEAAPSVAKALRQILDQQRDDFYIEYPCHRSSEDDPRHVIEQRWFQLRAGRFSHGDQTWVITAHENVTELKLTEGQLRASEARYRVVFERSPLGIATGGVDGRFLSANPAFCQMLGYTEDELRGMKVDHVTHPDDLAIDLAAKQSVAQGRESFYTIEKRYIHKHGHAVWVHVSATAVFTAEGEFSYGLVLAEDITARKKTEHALRRAERLASIGTLAAGIAHEVNNPLHGIVLYSEAARLTKDTPDAGATRDELFQKIQDEAMRCGRLVRSVLQFARQEASQKWPGTIDRIVRQSCDLTLPMAQRHEVKLEVELPELLPTVHHNPTEMQQVFVNLIQNAIQASPRGGRVRIGGSLNASHVNIHVQDFGHGMSAEQQQQMFDPFYTTRQKKGGTGLGLSITYGIVRDHGGSIDVISVLGQGTTVTVNLPYSP